MGPNQRRWGTGVVGAAKEPWDVVRLMAKWSTPSVRLRMLLCADHHDEWMGCGTGALMQQRAGADRWYRQPNVLGSDASAAVEGNCLIITSPAQVSREAGHTETGFAHGFADSMGEEAQLQGKGGSSNAGA